MSLQQYNNALSQYQNGADGMKNYIKGKSDMLKDKATGARDQAMGKAQAALANALQIDQGRKEQLENTIGTMAIAGPVIVKGVKQLGGKIAQYKAGTTPEEIAGTEGAEGDILAGGGGATEGTGGSSLGYAEAGEETTGTVARLPSGEAEEGETADVGGESLGGETELTTLPRGSLPAGADDWTGDDEPEIEGTRPETLPDEPVDTGSSYMSPGQGDNPFSGDIIGGEGAPSSAVNDAFGHIGDVETGFADRGAQVGGDYTAGRPDAGGTQDATAAEESTVGTAESTGAEASEDIAEGIGEDVVGGASEAIAGGAAALAGGGAAEAGALAAGAVAEGGAAAGLMAGAAAVGAVAMPLVAVGAVGYELYNLFHHSSHKDTTPAAPPPMAFTGSGIKDTFTSGGFAAASSDGITTSVSSNSAF